MQLTQNKRRNPFLIGEICAFFKFYPIRITAASPAPASLPTRSKLTISNRYTKHQSRRANLLKTRRMLFSNRDKFTLFAEPDFLPFGAALHANHFALRRLVARSSRACPPGRAQSRGHLSLVTASGWPLATPPPRSSRCPCPSSILRTTPDTVRSDRARSWAA